MEACLLTVPQQQPSILAPLILTEAKQEWYHHNMGRNTKCIYIFIEDLRRRHPGTNGITILKQVLEKLDMKI
jgi:hypothetical protein